MKKLVFLLLFFLILLPPARAASVNLIWDANTETNLAGYKIYYADTAATAGTAPIVTNVGNVVTVTIPNLEHGKRYSFYATAYNTAGLESGPSNTIYYSVPPDQLPAPVIISGDYRQSGQEIKGTLSWGRLDPETGVDVYIVTVETLDGTVVEVFETTYTGISFTLERDEYAFFVQARNEFTTSPRSEPQYLLKPGNPKRFRLSGQ